MNEQTTEATIETPAKKSIVPAKYGDKYKQGGDSVSQFIKDQITGKDSAGKDSIDPTAIFTLCRQNGVDEAQVTKYEALVADKENNHGIEGRSRMTLGNILRAKARKEGYLIAINGEKVEFSDLPKPVASGAAAAAKEKAAEKQAETTEEHTSDDAASADAATE